MAFASPEQDRACVPVAKRIRAALLSWDLPSEARVVDVGAGENPPYRECCPRGWEYVDVDIDAGDVHADGSVLPFRVGSFDVAVSNAVLEHLPDPAASLAEIARVVRPGGLLILATHGVYPYHPCPDDYTRWTRSGLARTVGQSFDVESVEPLGGIVLTLAILFGFYLELMGTRAVVLRPLRWLVPFVVGIGSRLDRLVPTMKDGQERWGAIAPAYIVRARGRS